MLLNGQVTLGEVELGVGHLGIDRDLAVDLDHNVVALGGDFLNKPSVGWNKDIINLDHIVKAAGLDLVAAGAVDLRFEPGWERLGVLHAEVLAAVALVADLGFNAINKIGKVVAFGEEVAGGAGALDGAVFHFPLRLVVGVGLPAGQILAIEQLDKATFWLVLRRGKSGQADQERAAMARHENVMRWMLLGVVPLGAVVAPARSGVTIVMLS